MAEVAQVTYTEGPYRHAEAIRNDVGEVFFRLPERVAYQERIDTIPYICDGNEMLEDVAITMFKGVLADPASAWWVIAEFQPEPIQDPTVPLATGYELLIPSPAFIDETARGDSLADEPEI